MTSNFGAKPCFLSSLRISRSAARCRGGAGPACRGPRPRDRPHARGTSACRNPHHHLVQMPSIARPRAMPAQPPGDHKPELQHPAPHRFIGDLKPTFGEQLFDVSVAQGEAEIQPNRVLDNLRRKAVAAIGEQKNGSRLSYSPPSRSPVSVTMPPVAGRYLTNPGSVRQPLALQKCSRGSSTR